MLMFEDVINGAMVIVVVSTSNGEGVGASQLYIYGTRQKITYPRGEDDLSNLGDNCCLKDRAIIPRREIKR